MIRIVLSIIWCAGLLFGGTAPELNEKYGDSAKCKPCHAETVNEWMGSLHSKSHYNSNEYLHKSIDYVGRKSRKSKNAIKVQCAACHNPRIAVTSTDMDYEIMAAMKLDNLSEVNRALKSDSLNEGFNCLVCHNVDKIDHQADETVRGLHRLHWNSVGTMSGPIDDASSPYHKTQKRQFFKEDSNKLCFVGTYTQSRWEGALTLSVVKKENDLLIVMNNANPHNLPSGFGARELIIDVTYRSEQKVLASKSVSLTQRYI